MTRSIATREEVRNVAIIAHVDHGKTTLVDGLMREAGSFRRGEVVAERALDTNELERERGITILSKPTSITWRGMRINLVDTPGHADFGGEVERILGMVDGVLLLVDAFEGPMPQTRFVTQKAFAMGLSALVVINKIDRDGADPDGALNAVFDLFCSLGASDEQLDFPVIYASGRDGYAVRELDDPRESLVPLIETIAKEVPPPVADTDAALCCQVATLMYDAFLGYLAIGRIASGTIRAGDRVVLARHDGTRTPFRAQKLLGFQGLRRFELSEGRAGDIIAVTGMSELCVGDTIASAAEPRALAPLAVDEPTMRMSFVANDGPFVGTEGTYVTSRNLRERLFREIKSNIALRVVETDAGLFEVSGRGELHLSILIETMRREGYELCVSQPQVILHEDEQGNVTEPYEIAVIDVEQPYSGVVIEEANRRLGQMQEMHTSGPDRVRIEYLIPSRGLIGYRSKFLTDTRGTGVVYQQFDSYGPKLGELRGRPNGVMIALEVGTSNAYALFSLQDRGALIIGPGTKVYGGMIVGENARGHDLIVNPNRAKKLDNMRTHAADEKLILTPPRKLTLETAIEPINEDELVEITPESLRLRKRTLDHNRRKREAKRPS